MLSPSFHNVVEFIAFLASCLWCFRQEKLSFRLFIPFLLYTFLNEYLGCYYKNVLHKPNVFLYTIYAPIAYVFYSLQLVHFISRKQNTIIVSTLAIIGLLFSIINAFYGQGFTKFNTLTNITLSFLLIINCFIYLFDLLAQPNKTIKLQTEPLFWVVAGLLFFNFGWLTINALYKYALANELKIFGKEIYSQIMKVLNVLLYGSLIISFRLCYKKKKFIY